MEQHSEFFNKTPFNYPEFPIDFKFLVEDLESLSKAVLSAASQVEDLESNCAAYFHQGMYLLEKDLPEDSARAFRRSVLNDSECAAALAALGVFYSYLSKMECYAEPYRVAALVAIKRALELAPQVSEFWHMMAIVFDNCGIAQTTECLASAVNLKPDSYQALLDYARDLYWRKDRKSEAYAVFSKALDVRSDDWLSAYNYANFCPGPGVGENDPDICEYRARYTRLRKSIRKRTGLDQLKVRVITGVHRHIGHYGTLDDIAKATKLGWFPTDHQYFVIAPRNETVNETLLNHYRKYFPIISDEFAVKQLKPLEIYLEIDWDEIPNYNQRWNGDFYRMRDEAQMEWERAGNGPLLELDPVVEERGEKQLRELGVPKDAWFVGIHARENAFKNDALIHGVRNSDIMGFVPAIREITKRGGWVIRMGEHSVTPLPKMPQVIDYARSGKRSDWMDTFLWARCRFFVGGNSGPTLVPKSFARPTVYVNLTPLTAVPIAAGNLVIPKHFYDKRSGRELTLREYLDPQGPVGWVHSSVELERRGITFTDNTPEEILSVTIEMLDRLDGKITYTDQNRKTQENILALIKRLYEKHCRGCYTAQIGRDFLEKNSHLLEL